MPIKKTSRMAFVEHTWKVVFSQIDKGRQRSGKALARQSEVSFMSIENNYIHARIVSKGFDGGIYFVELPCVDNWCKKIDDLAILLAHRLDLLAACLSGELNDEFLSLVEKEGLCLFPDEQYANKLRWEAKCTCSSPEPICKHVVGVLYKMIWEMESKPLRSLEFVCVDPQILICKIHLFVARRVKEIGNPVDKEFEQGKTSEKFFSTKILESEKLTYIESEFSKESFRSRQMIPEFETDDLKEKRDIYMAWE